MASPVHLPPVLRFGQFELNPASGELRKAGIPVKIGPQPFRVLLLLAERPRQVVTRMEIQRCLWGDDTFVDYEHGINFCVNQIRAALCDDAEKPRYVETLPRRGYRFIASVSTQIPAEPAPARAPIDISSVPRAVAAEPDVAVKDRPVQPPRQKTKTFQWQWMVATAIVAVFFFVAFFARPEAPLPRVRRIQQITHLGAVTQNQNLLVRGSRIYFMTTDNGEFRLKYMSLNDNSVSSIHNLTPKAELHDISPSGSELLITEIEVGFPALQWMRSLWKVPIAGTTPQRVGNVLADDAAWSPDGRTIVYTHELEQSLNLVNLDATNARRIATLPGRPFKPRWSPNGKLIRTSLIDKDGRISFWQVEASGKNLARILPGWDDSSQLESGKWTVDGRFFLFTALKGGVRNIWMLPDKRNFLPRNSSQASQLTAGPISFFLPTPAPDGKTIYAVGHQPRGQLMRYDARSRQFEPYLNGLSGDQLSFSSDGLWVAYVAYPEGDLMISRLDGSQRLQLTFSPMRAYAPRWSPNGSQIAFAGSAAPGKPRKVLVVSARGGSTRLLAPEIGGEQVAPDWLDDGKSILFGSWSESRETASLHVVDVKTGHDTLLPGTLGLAGGRVSPDGRSIAAISDSNQSVVLYDMASHEKRMLAQVGVFPNWSGDGRYIYYSTLMLGAGLGSEAAAVYRVRVSNDQIERLIPAPSFPLTGNWGFWSGIAPDGSLLVLREMGTSDVYALDVEGLQNN